MVPALSVLRTILGSDANVVKLLLRCGWFLSYDLEKFVMPNVEFLKSHSVPMEQIIKTMPTSPRFLLQRPEHVRRCAEKAEELGARPGSNMYIHAVKVIATMGDEAWKLKLEAFRSLGFSESDISNAFSKYPTAFAVSVKKMREVRDVLVSTGKYDEASIIQYPMSFASSVEKRFKPRLRVLASLEGKGLIKKWPSLASLCTQSDLCFFRKYVGPHIDEVGHLFIVKGA